MLKYRLITGSLLIALIVGLVWLDDALEAKHFDGVPRGIVIFGLALVLVALIARELATLLGRAGVVVPTSLSIIAATATFVTMVLAPYLQSPQCVAACIATLLVVVLVAGLIHFSRGQNLRGVMGATAGLLLVCIYAGVFPAFWMYLRHYFSAWILVGAILTTKSCDTGAYFTGVSIGRHKLIPWLSPGKTWEGLFGGIVTAAAVGAGLAQLSNRLPDPNHVTWQYGACIGAILALVGQFGDLAESLLKREAGVKDSGRLMPGMGGVLDVLDSPLMTGPAVYWLLAAQASTT